MVAIGDVGARHGGKGRRHGLDGRRPRHAPHGLAHALLVREVIQGLGRGRKSHQRVHREVVAVRQEDRARLRAGRADVLHAVLLLVAARVLVAADRTVKVLVHGGGAHHARLGAAVLLEAVHVVARRLVVQQRAVRGGAAQQLGGLRVHVRGVHVVVGREGRLRPVDG